MNQCGLRLDHQLQCVSASLKRWSVMTFHVKIWFLVSLILIQEIQCMDAMQVCSETLKCCIWLVMVKMSVITSKTSARSYVDISITVERLMDDQYKDHKIHQDLRVYLGDICFILQMPYQTLRERTRHCWLSVLEVAQWNLATFNAFTVIYAAWLPKDVKASHMDVVNQLIASMSVVGQKRIVEIRKVCQKGIRSKQKTKTPSEDFHAAWPNLAPVPHVLQHLANFQIRHPYIWTEGPDGAPIYDDVIDITKKFLSSVTSSARCTSGMVAGSGHPSSVLSCWPCLRHQCHPHAHSVRPPSQ